MKQSIVSNGLKLTAFALVTTAIIAITYAVTEDQITEQQIQKRLAILNAIIPQSLYDNDIHHDCTQVVDTEYLGSKAPQTVYLARMNNAPSAVAIETTAPDGYSGKIELIVGINMQSEVTGVRILDHKETPGLGDKIDIRITDWITAFTGKSVTTDNHKDWQVKKDGGQFDQFTGATITPRAVVKAVKNAVLYFQHHQQDLFNATKTCEAMNDQPINGKVE
ncbi:electron transport complex subunit RsxG [Aliiglaciecola sp. 2_MG-2023]|uniref:electron transport complex subunit RsxG n=1 Tax=unclassified Aliiglaciecola TaxID=2593648 RepID=UPI0026E45014|nr:MULTISPECIES: electron transport complex subunit RsxG [unclassified Aliiglaciecola]MDO6710997.1 electron transport complex subunit RsxG [Aliiglaciecola sp. 2_MG-2023]MDO6754207.1 electron transport complex subunit RsxG [Aliiglaciecola sp. 1_MG-2023]